MAGKPDFTLTMGLVGASTIVTGLQSMTQLLGQLIGRVREVSTAIDEYGDVQRGHTISIEEAQTATAAQIDTITMHRQASRLQSAGIRVTSNEYRALSMAALDYAKRTGTDARQAMEQLTQATVSASTRGLRPFGIALREGGTQAERQRRVIEQLTGAYGDQTYAVSGLQDHIVSLQNTWQRAWLEMASAIERSSGPIGSVLQRITGWIDGVANALETQRQAAEHMARMGTETRQREIEQQLNSMGVDVQRSRPGDIIFHSGGRVAGFAEMVSGAANMATESLLEGNFGEAVLDVTEAGGRVQARASELIAEMDRLARGDIRDIQSGAQPVVRERELTDIPDEPDAPGGPSEAERARQRLAGQIAAKERAVYDALRDSETRIEDLYARQRERLEGFWTEYGDAQKAAAEDAFEKRVEAEEAAMQRLTEAQDRYMERVLEGVRREEEARTRAIERTQEYATTTSQIFNMMSGAISGLAESLASTTEQQEQIRGAFYLAEQVGAFLLATTMAAINYAGENYAQAAMYTAAAVVAGLGIAKTAIEFGVSSRSGTNGSSSGAGGRGSSSATRGSQGGTQHTTYVQIYGPVSSRRVHEEIVSLERDAARAY